MFKRSLTSLIILLLTVSILSACSSGINVGGLFADDESAEPNYNIGIAIESMDTLNPAISKGEDCYYISKLIYSGLFKFDDMLVPQPDLAVSYSYDSSHSSVDITLRDDVVWHDGERFTPQDVKFTIDAYKTLAASGQTIYAQYVANIRSVTVSAANRVTIVFGSDDAVGIESLVFPILPSHLFRNASALASAEADFKPVGTGMYKVEEYNAMKNLILTANEDYYGEKAENKIIFQILPSRNDGVNLMDINDVMLVFSKDYGRDTLIANRNLKVKSYLSNETETLVFNCARSIISDKNVRQAIAYLIDNESILEKVYYKNGVLADSIIYDNFYGIENEGDIYTADIEKAQELLLKAGCYDRDEDGYRDDRDGNMLEFSLLVDGADSYKYQTAVMIKSALESCGMIVNMDIAEGEAYQEKLRLRDYDMLIANSSINERYDLRSLIHSAYNNPAMYANETADSLTVDMVSANTVREKAETTAKLKDILIDEVPYYPIIRKTYGVVYSQDFDGELNPMFNNIYNDCGKWSYTKKIKKS